MVKKFFVFMIMVCLFFAFNVGASEFSTQPIDYAGYYNLMIPDFGKYPVKMYKYSLMIDENGLYTLLENRVIGSHQYEYPVLYGVWFLDVDNEEIVFNVDGLEIPFKNDGGVLIANTSVLNGQPIIAYDKSKICFFSLSGQCKFDIVGDNKVTVGDSGKYFVTSNHANCLYNINTDNCTIEEIKYSKTGDAIVTINFDTVGVAEINVNGEVLDINVIER